MIRVLIDPGHGGVSDGCQWPPPPAPAQVEEAAVNLRIALAIADQLVHEPEISWVITRTADVTVPLHERHLDAAGKHLVLSIHCDSDSPGAHGIACYVSRWNERTQAVAKAILDATPDELKPGRLILCPDAGYPRASGLVQGYHEDVVLIECGFLSDRDDREYLLGTCTELVLALRTGLRKAVEVYRGR
jgi:N-acetylmuramoyl-L-alanine amidase